MKRRKRSRIESGNERRTVPNCESREKQERAGCGLFVETSERCFERDDEERVENFTGSPLRFSSTVQTYQRELKELCRLSP